MITWLVRWWRARQQAIDLKILWPSVYEQACDIEHARTVFRVHMELDPAYSWMTSIERDAYAARLPIPPE